MVTTQQIFQYGVKSVKQRIAVGSQVDLHTAKPGPGGFLIAIVVTSDKIASWLKQFYDVCGCRLQSTDPLPQTSDVKGTRHEYDEVSRGQEGCLRRIYH